MKYQFSLILFFILFTITVNGQTNFKDGAIITNQGDTLVGKADYRGDKLMCKVCTFKSKDLGKKKYNPDKITAYYFKDGRFFKSVIINEKAIFAELLVTGTMSIYYHQGKIYNESIAS